MKNIFKVFLLLSLSVFFACEDPYKDSEFKVYDVLPISAYLDSRPNEFSEWTNIMRYADMYNAINQAGKVYTAFVPTNEAVRVFLNERGVDSIQQLGIEYARELVKAHVTQDSISMGEFIMGGTLAKKTLADNFLKVSFGEEGGYNSVFLNEGVPVKEFALPAANGLVYVLNGVMRPLIIGLYSQMVENGENKILAEAMKLTTWSDSLNTISIITEDYSSGTKKEIRRYYTVLAVSDNVYNSKGISSVNDLINYLGAGSDYSQKENALFQYVAYHIMAGSYTTQAFKVFDTDESNVKLWECLATNHLIKITKEGDNYYLNQEGGDKYKAQVIEEKSDYPVKNGNIHQIDNILPVCNSLTPIPLYFDVTNFPEVASYIASNGTDGLIYQTAAAAEKNLEMPLDQFSCYTVKMSPAGSLCATQGNGAFKYYTVKNAVYEYSKAMNNDFLMIGLGRGGYVEMRTPPLLSGRYKITVRYVYANTMVNYRDQKEGNGGLTTFGITDMGISTSKLLYSVLGTKTMGLYDMVLFEDITFGTTGSHNFRITLDDAAASNSKNYRVQIDYVLFEPIK